MKEYIYSYLQAFKTCSEQVVQEKLVSLNSVLSSK